MTVAMHYYISFIIADTALGTIIGCLIVIIVLGIPACVCFTVCVWAIYKSRNYKPKNNTIICSVPPTGQASNQASTVQNSPMPNTCTNVPFKQERSSHPTIQPVYDTVQDLPIPPPSTTIVSVTMNQAYGCCSNQLAKHHAVNGTCEESLEEYEEMSQPTIVVQDNDSTYYV